MQLFCSRRVLNGGMTKSDYFSESSTRVEEQLSTSIRILLADDFRGWRLQNRLLLQMRPEWQVIAEASDGSEAVQRAEELKPDLILLDIGLPRLNGIEAALRIRQVSPRSKILFLSLHNSPDVVQAALNAGARGYVHKTNAQSELLPAVDAVLRGERYVSSSLRGYKFNDTSGEGAPHRHEVLFYSDDTVLLDGFTRFVAAALKAGNAAIVLATKSHRDSLLQRLQAEGVNAYGALRQGTYVPLDAADALSNVMVDGLPDSVRFFEGIGGHIEAAAKKSKSRQPRVVVCGEGVALLHAEGKADAAILIERGCNHLVETHEVDILCAYPLSSFHGEKGEHVFQSICAEHSAIFSR
jgi:DNA-binding NarL/FixJ family response regulator